MSDLVFVLIAGTAVLLGALVQSGAGLGLGLIAAPVVSMLDPSLMPGSMLVATAVLPMLTIGSEWRHVDFRGVSWALAGRMVGTVAGVWVVAVLSPRTLGIAVGILVLVAVALTVSTVRLRPTPRTLSVAGTISGVTGTATSIGGPPIALVYQHETGPRVRATLGGYFIVGALVSLVALAVGGQLQLRELLVGCVFVPFTIAGFLLARPLRRFLDGPCLRWTLLVLITASGTVLLVRSLLA
ncbi:sulfite exporter TauE/SafE family protein [Nocardiopsis ansamitocini]|uniref:Probable membrane transporter protein n=1 Tax=Nocardiopsis ansamitocini TaxID=1670832 RepID=A0A9W6P8A3_9ACTN|nr:sulfite exporter TauE/SafE family protein [Nocardiopsis ansamitocini]GLU48990.1 permease [Nocardiopsis ansamitocini]